MAGVLVSTVLVIAVLDVYLTFLDLALHPVAPSFRHHCLEASKKENATKP